MGKNNSIAIRYSEYEYKILHKLYLILREEGIGRIRKDFDIDVLNSYEFSHKGIAMLALRHLERTILDAYPNSVKKCNGNGK